MVDGVFVDVGAGRLVSVGVFAAFPILVRAVVVRSVSFAACVGLTVRVEVGFGRVVLAGFGHEGVRVGVLVCVGMRVEVRVGMEITAVRLGSMVWVRVMVSVGASVFVIVGVRLAG